MASKMPRKFYPTGLEVKAWACLYKGLRDSGMSCPAFCRRMNIAPANFQRWCDRIDCDGGPDVVLDMIAKLDQDHLADLRLEFPRSASIDAGH